MQRRAAGFSLIELMVVVAILGLVTAQVLGIFSSQLETYQGQKAVLETQDDARLASDLMFLDVRMAGYMVAEEVAISGVDGGTGDSDVLCVSDPNVLNDARVNLASDRFAGADLASDLGGTAGSVSLVSADLDIDGDGDDDFEVDAGIIITDGTNTHCARIESISSGTVAFTPDTPGGFAATQISGSAAPAIVYERTAAGLTRNALLVSGQVEDLQVEYGVDANDDGQLTGSEFPVHGLNGSDPSLVRLVRLSVLARTTREDPQLTGPGRQAVGNRTAAGTADAFRRRLVTVSATPRNLM